MIKHAAIIIACLWCGPSLPKETADSSSAFQACINESPKATPQTPEPEKTYTDIFSAINAKASDQVIRSLTSSQTVNRQLYQGITPLMYAAAGGDWRIISTLIDLGAEVNLKTASGYPLLSAIATNNYAIACKLILKGATLPSSSIDRMELMRTALIVEPSDFEASAIFIDLLLSNGFNKNDMDDVGYTPIMAAVALDAASIVRVFVKHDANLNTVKKSGRTVWTLARKKNNPQVLKLLQEAEAQKKTKPKKR